MPSAKIKVEKGAIWRNKDIAFERELQKPIYRKIPICISVDENQDTWNLIALTSDLREVKAEINLSKTSIETALNFDTTRTRFEQNLAKTGDTPFIANVKIKAQTLPYLKISQLNRYRRDLLDKLQNNIISGYETKRAAVKRRSPEKRTYTTQPFTPDKYANVYNESAKQFYADMGFDIKQYAPETQKSLTDTRLMTTRHCILRELGMCKKLGKTKQFKEPFYLKNSEISLQIKFDCTRCGMSIFAK